MKTLAVDPSAFSNDNKMRMPSSVVPVVAPTLTPSGATEQCHFGASTTPVEVAGNARNRPGLPTTPTSGTRAPGAVLSGPRLRQVAGTNTTTLKGIRVLPWLEAADKPTTMGPSNGLSHVSRSSVAFLPTDIPRACLSWSGTCTKKAGRRGYSCPLKKREI